MGLVVEDRGPRPFLLIGVGQVGVHFPLSRADRLPIVVGVDDKRSLGTDTDPVGVDDRIHALPFEQLDVQPASLQLGGQILGISSNVRPVGGDVRNGDVISQSFQDLHLVCFPVRAHRFNDIIRWRVVNRRVQGQHER